MRFRLPKRDMRGEEKKQVKNLGVVHFLWILL
jgi:hypothetical protein